MNDHTSGSRPTIAALTGIRGIAALWVAAHHMMGRWLFAENDYGALSRIIDRGWLGVDLFFILSGFVISYVHRDDFKLRITKPGFSKFIVLRIARIYPVHLVMTVAFIPVIFVSTYLLNFDLGDTFSIKRLLYSLTLTNGWGFEDSIGWNGPSWSVSSEWFVYLCFPILALFFSRFKGIAISFAVIIGVFCLAIFLSNWIVDGKQYMLPWRWNLFRVSSAFIIGCALRNLFDHLNDSAIWDHIALFSILLIVTYCAYDPSDYFDFLLMLFFSTLIISLSRSKSHALKLFGSKFLVYLGTISYSIYMVHYLFIVMLSKLGREPFRGSQLYEWSTQVGVATMFILVTIVAAHILCFKVETPMRRIIKERYDRRH